ncbi:transmembrane sensor histidine kinase transcription regulator protein [Cupriavidus basilensis OR16]|uniref:histidine kinase n=1 Tax=Cupriavidus basilensis OR16 TaxID=1127483 RepID=H1S583_9BURK|nr:ATP-binding protein [Cupriavidus basilensis]EHP42250.1 transmembrane sensor histidine kinase transcription regulator protein [Cupriavidus basilensis OR16]
MVRSLLKLYLLVILAAAAAVTAINTTFIPLFHEHFTATERENRRGYAFTLSQYLGPQRGKDRDAALSILQEQAREKFDLVDAASLTHLDAQQLADLAAGKLVLGYDAKDYYLPLRDGQILHALSEEEDHTNISVLAYALIALATLLSIIAWVWYHWRDLDKLQQAARDFGGGKLSTRANLPRRSNIAALATQFNEMAEQIEASIVHQREMMHGISHELKTPIARLEFGIALLQSAGTGDAERARQALRLEDLRRDVRELDELVTELLTLGQLEQGAAPMMLMRVSVSELIDSVAASLADEVADNKLTLSVHVTGPRPHHVCDPRLVARALLNLCRNATRYARSAIHLRAETDAAGRLRLTVEDDGPGIAPEERARIFEPFHRPDSSRNRHTGGFGLGLAIVRRIALLHGGQVGLDSGSEGGARFVIALPPMDERAMPGKPSI